MMRNIILTGPKHSGKTSTGKALASLLSCDFTDTDDMILQRTGKTPRELFIEGQNIFKKAEAEVSEKLAEELIGSSEKRIIATGGGIIDNPDALAFIKKINTVVVYLNIYAESAWSRISNSSDGVLPPVFGAGNPRETHRLMHERRSAAYNQLADIIIFAEGKTPDEIAGEIIESITAFG